MSLPRLTASIPGCGGHIKEVPEDFEVEELPAYAPSGTGEHLFIWIEKRGRDTPKVALELSRALGLPARDVTFAGMKDRHAVTRQFLCVPASAEGALPNVALDGVKLLSWARHGNRLKTGHLNGNRFRLRVRGVRDAHAAAQSLELLSRRGVPNYFGEQRFGVEDQNAGFGKKLLLGERLARAPSRFLRKLYLSAYQSLLFNRCLAARVANGTMASALEGDVLRKEDTGGLFVCSEPPVDQPRVDRWEVSAAGPMFGPKMVAAAGVVAEAEEAVLRDEGVPLDAFRRGRGETEGTRRAYRVHPADISWGVTGDVLELAFSLPKGAYATVLLDELIKATP